MYHKQLLRLKSIFYDKVCLNLSKPSKNDVGWNSKSLIVLDKSKPVFKGLIAFWFKVFVETDLINFLFNLKTVAI